MSGNILKWVSFWCGTVKVDLIEEADFDAGKYFFTVSVFLATVKFQSFLILALVSKNSNN